VRFSVRDEDAVWWILWFEMPFCVQTVRLCSCTLLPRKLRERKNEKSNQFVSNNSKSSANV
jgi:hypothetical protein